MDERRLRAFLDAAVGTPPASVTWGDVLARARRSRRGRRVRRTAIGVLVGLGVLFASLASAGRLPFQVAHSREPHVTMRATLFRPDGSGAGTLEIEVERVFITPGKRLFVDRFQPHGNASPTADIRARWFLALDGSDSDTTVSLRRLERGAVVLCSRCGTRASGRVDLSTDDVAALANAAAPVTVAASDGHRVAAGDASLVSSQLRAGLICAGPSRTRLRCSRIYTGRP